MVADEKASKVNLVMSRYEKADQVTSMVRGEMKHQHRRGRAGDKYKSISWKNWIFVFFKSSCSSWLNLVELHPSYFMV